MKLLLDVDTDRRMYTETPTRKDMEHDIYQILDDRDISVSFPDTRPLVEFILSLGREELSPEQIKDGAWKYLSLIANDEE